MHVTALSLTDYVFMFFVILTLACLATRRDALLPTSLGLLVVGMLLTHSVVGGVEVAFKAVMASTTDLLNIIIVIALVVAMTKTMEDMGSDRLMVSPIRKFLHNPNVSYWIIGIAMLIVSWFIWPTPAAALLGALLLPVAIVGGLPPLIAGMALAIFGKGIALSSDFIIQGTPSVTAKLTHIPVGTIMGSSIPIWAVVSIVATVVAFLIARKAIKDNQTEECVSFDGTLIEMKELEKAAAASVNFNVSPIGRVMAWLIPLAFLADIIVMFNRHIIGDDATALIGGTTLAITMVSAVFQYKDEAFKKVMEHVRSGWKFAVTVFGPVVIIAGFFWLGGDSLKEILGNPHAQGLMFDWGYFIAAHVPINKFVVAVMVVIAGILAAFDGSGYAAIPLSASIAMALGTPIHANVAYLASLGQMAAIWTGATLVPWGFLAVSAAVAGVDPQDLARRNMWPTLLGLAAGILITVYLA
ncbi:hypothetical protein [Desulfotomaculum copahuensis]|uniref:Citrate transporter n=1 Tax=Desulfotomaculum copahuensis TaxID=1838280 RepID=A0A1B7LI42_9FIRM|nr:hypothetical protein [Desulfotomaculum copahuensis]OAT86085.1 hypothetical protein A6M21_03950 [Desulfotomaculum copahuensis]